MEPSMDWWFESKKYWSLGIVVEKKTSHHPCDHQPMMCLVKQMSSPKLSEHVLFLEFLALNCFS